MDDDDDDDMPLKSQCETLCNIMIPKSRYVVSIDACWVKHWAG